MFFFFKQKTAYEMRISDWSSDVCSSDLVLHPVVACQRVLERKDFDIRVIDRNMADILIHQHAGCAVLPFAAVADRRQLLLFFRSDIGAMKSGNGNRSEEHTYEIQSLMRIMYAVFCLKQKTKNHTT